MYEIIQYMTIHKDCLCQPEMPPDVKQAYREGVTDGYNVRSGILMDRIVAMIEEVKCCSGGWELMVKKARKIEYEMSDYFAAADDQLDGK